MTQAAEKAAGAHPLADAVDLVGPIPDRRPRLLSRRAAVADSALGAAVAPPIDLTDDALAASSRVHAPVGAYSSFVKPVIDRCTAFLLLFILSPLIGLVALAVRVKLGPGVIYRQQRVGRGGGSFTIYKFRTMTRDRRVSVTALPDGIPDRRQTHKTDDDPRHTPLGRFLRKTSLDELPQLWNVFAGRMSLVGPRPELTSVVASYEPWQHERHLVLPGITGLWQVSERTTTAMHEATELDIDYVRRFGFKLDLWILARTAGALRRGGS